MDRPNLLLIVLDSIRADRLSCYGYGRPTSPHIDRIAAEGVRFDNAYSESSWTLPATFTILTGLAPREHQAERTRRLPAGMPVLPEVLKRRGYFSFAASANTFFGPRCGLQRGFDTFFMPPHALAVTRPLVKYVAQRLGWADEGGQAIASSFASTLDARHGPWFGLLWLNDAHHPYVAKEPFTRRFCEQPLSLGRQVRLASRMRRILDLAAGASEEDLVAIRGLYDGCVAYEDMIVGRVRETLEQRGQWENTVVALVADHGDMLGERRLMGHGAAADMYRPLLRVPLILRVPGATPAGVASDALVQTADLAHTLTSLAGVPGSLARTAAPTVDLVPAAQGSGRPYAISEREALTERRRQNAQRKNRRFDFAPHLCHMTAVVQDGWRLIHRTDGRHELYHVTEDPGETTNLVATEPARFRALSETLVEWQAQARPHTSADDLPADTDPIVEKRLQELGYF